MPSVCFTGHRFIKKAILENLKQRLYCRLEEMISQGYTDFYAGGAIGFDTLCAEAVISLKEKYPHIRLNLILPCPPNEQTLNWKNADKNRYNVILSHADNIEIISPHYTDSCMYERNRQLINCGDYCICFYDSRRISSGTGQTVRLAMKKNITVENLFTQENAL